MSEVLIGVGLRPPAPAGGDKGGGGRQRRARAPARESPPRIEMPQIGARDTTKVMDGIGPCGRQLCCSSPLRRFEPISVKMAKAQDMPLTDNRLIGNCGRLKCCLLYEFSTYDELRSRLPRTRRAGST